MSLEAVPEPSFEDTLTRVEELVGRISAGQHDLLRRCLTEDELGFWRLVQRIGARAGGMASPVGALVNSLKAGEHRGPKPGASVSPSRVYLPLPRPTPEQQRHYFEIGEGWKLIDRYMHHPTIVSLRRELKRTCRNPEEPTNEEAARVRETLLFAISEL